MITAFFTPYFKFLQKDSYLKFFNDVDNLSDLISKIKVEDEIKIYAHSKDIIKFQFGNTKQNISYEVLEEGVLFEEFNNNSINDRVKAKVKDQWKHILFDYVYIVQNRELQLELVKKCDILTFMATDLNDLVQSLQCTGEIPDMLVAKMFVDDRELSKYDENGMLKDEYRSK